jgi:tRNA pseudouridine55 synthase
MNKQPEKVINFYKYKGETPLEALERLRKTMPEYADETLSYAGRLDPAAEGVVVVLVGEENKNREEHLGLDKEYKIQILFGVSTDTYDLLGKVTEFKEKVPEIIESELRQVLEEFKGRSMQKYPAYSSKVVNGIPLFEHARKDTLGGIIMPKREIYIYAIDVTEIRKISTKELLNEVKNITELVKGDFRQQEILELWHQTLSGKNTEFQIATIDVSCSSGTYMRSLANDLGLKLSIPALAASIIRIRVGPYTIEESIRPEISLEKTE